MYLCDNARINFRIVHDKMRMKLDILGFSSIGSTAVYGVINVIIRSRTVTIPGISETVGAGHVRGW